MKKTIPLIPLLLAACIHQVPDSPPPEVTKGPAVTPPVIGEDAIPAVETPASPAPVVTVPLSPAERMHMELMALREDKTETGRSSSRRHLHSKFATCEVSRVRSPYQIEVQSSGGRFRVNLAGLDPFERELEGASPSDPFYQKAQAWLQSTVTDRRLHVVFDINQLDSDDRGEATGYVFYRPWGTDRWVFLNREAIAEGMALYHPMPGWMHDAELRQAEMDARFARKGIWAEQIRRWEESAPPVPLTGPPSPQ